MGQPTNGACTNGAWPTQCVQVEKMYSSVSDRISNKVYTLLHKYLQESSINLEFSPGGSAFLVEYLM